MRTGNLVCHYRSKSIFTDHLYIFDLKIKLPFGSGGQMMALYYFLCKLSNVKNPNCYNHSSRLLAFPKSVNIPTASYITDAYRFIIILMMIVHLFLLVFLEKE